MIKAIESLDRMVAAGLLAQAALSVGYLDDPSGQPKPELLSKVIEEARGRLGLQEDDNSPEAFERIADFLDQESDKLLAPPNTESALVRLAERGDLPSDLYEINIIPNVVDVYRKGFPLEKEIIETTIRSPTLEQHYGSSGKPHEPVMISLFVRSFRTKWPLRDFSVVVAGQRSGFRLDVHQAWRIYPWKVKLDGVVTPVDWLRRFADYYGAEIEVEGRRGHFFLLAEGVIPEMVTLHNLPNRPGRETGTMVSRFVQKEFHSGVERSALIVAIDIFKYRATLDELGVRREDILDRFVPAPRARE